MNGSSREQMRGRGREGTSELTDLDHPVQLGNSFSLVVCSVDSQLPARTMLTPKSSEPLHRERPEPPPRSPPLPPLPPPPGLLLSSPLPPTVTQTHPSTYRLSHAQLELHPVPLAVQDELPESLEAVVREPKHERLLNRSLSRGRDDGQSRERIGRCHRGWRRGWSPILR